MNVIIRTDASIHIGSGHVMRCLVLAKGLREKGAKIIFICRNFIGNLCHVIEKEGFICKLLPFSSENYIKENYDNEYAFWLAVSQEQDVCETKKNCNEPIDLLIVDHYGLDVDWESSFRHACNKIFVIDDLANRKHDCDFLLDHNYYFSSDDRYINLVSSKCRRLIGCQYALIDKKVIAAREWRKKHHLRSNAMKFNIVIFIGGSDLDEVTEKIAKVLVSYEIFSVLYIVVSMLNDKFSQIKESFSRNPHVTVLQHPGNYFEILADADIVIGAAGVSVLERCCIGLASFVIQVADNQKEICEHIVKTGAASFLGISSCDSWIARLETILKNISQEKVMEMERIASLLVDGLGLSRCIEVIYDR